MNFGDMKQRAAYLAQMAGMTTANPQPDWGALINDSLQNFSWETEYNIETVTINLVLNQAEYTIANPVFITVKQVWIGTNVGLALTCEADETHRDANWITRVAGTPMRYFMTSPNIIRLVDKPSDVTVYPTLSLRGTRVAPALSTDTDVPNFPDPFHDALCYRAAAKYCESFADMGQGAADGARLASYLHQYQTQADACRFHISQKRYGQLVRRVRQPQRPRVDLTGYSIY